MMEDELRFSAEETASTVPGIEPALAEHEQEVDRAEKVVKRLTASVKQWRKACVTGHLANRRKAAQTSVQLMEEATGVVQRASDSWQFDAQAYLEGPEWRQEVIETARERYGLRVLDDEPGDQLISAPVAVQAQPGREALRIGRAAWPHIRPAAVIAELKRLRDTISAANSQEFLDALFAACQREMRDGRMFIKFRDAYELFCLAPGYRKETPRPVFAMALYGLHRSGITATRSGKTIQWEWPSGNPKDKDVFEVRAEDGRLLRYYGIWFR